MASNYEYENEPPWDIPITCFAAHDDPYVSRRQALGWGYFTDARLQVHIREGAHFAVVDDASFIQSVINRELLGNRRRGSGLAQTHDLHMPRSKSVTASLNFSRRIAIRL